ncbi:MAG: response regulator, partial [Acidobacteriota bacterium]
MPSVPHARIVLFGLNDPLAGELRAALGEPNVYPEPFLRGADCLRVVERRHADVVFCAAEPARYLDLLEAVKREKPDLPVIVVSRIPEVSQWLDALEAGASDYCAAPFESSHLRWMLEANLKHHAAPARYQMAS